jgi:hypothetical protein
MKANARTLLLTAGAVALTLGAVAEVPADANEEGQVALVCYQWDAFPEERLRVSIRKPAPVTAVEPAEQVEWGLTGKHVGACGEGTSPIVRGTIIADEVEGSAHMGIYSIVVRGDEDMETCRTVNWNCSAPEPVRAPDQWLCESRNEFDVYQGSSTLTKITDPAGDPLCGVFETGFVDSAEGSSSGQVN